MSNEKWKKDTDPNEFWALIALGRTDLDEFRAKLRKMDRRALIRFCWMFEEAASEFSLERYRRHTNPSLSEDAYDDLAEWIVGQGREYYERILANPKQMPKDIDYDDPAMFMRYEAGSIFAKRFGEEIPAYGYDY